MPWGGQRTGAGRPTDNKNRKNIHYRIDASTAEKFATDCKCLCVPLNAVVEMLMTEWMSDQRVEIEQARAELMKGPAKFSKRPCSPDNLEHLNKIRTERRMRLAIVRYRLAKSKARPTS
jgi:hypothetical protein